MNVMHFILALPMAGLCFGMDGLDSEDPPTIQQQPESEGIRTPTGAGTPRLSKGFDSHIRVEDFTKTAVMKPAHELPLTEGDAPNRLAEGLRSKIHSTTSGDLTQPVPEDAVDSDYLETLQKDFKSVLDELTHPHTHEAEHGGTWTSWVKGVSGSHLDEATRAKLVKALETFTKAGEFSKITLQQATSNLILSRALEAAELLWPSDLNFMQTHTALMHYGTLHTFELTLPPHAWTDKEEYLEIADSLIKNGVNYDSYSTPNKLVELLIGPRMDWGKLPPYELHWWRRIGGCDFIFTRLRDFMNSLPIPTLPVGGRTSETDFRALQEKSLTKAWFYMALPGNVLLRSVNSWIDGLARGTLAGGSTWQTAELEIKTAMEQGGDWIPPNGNLNLHYTARGALAMALFVFGTLSRDSKKLFANENMLLLRFKLPLAWIVRSYTNQSLRLWNRLYFEHSLHSTQPIKLDALSLRTLRCFEFNHLKHNKLQFNITQKMTVAQMFATQKRCMKVMGELNFYENYHLMLPIPLKEKLALEAETKRKRGTGSSTD